MTSISNRIILFSIGLWFAVQPSYLHPDEHFQSLEILCDKFYNYKGFVPWEFESKHAARSFIPLYIFYGPLLCGLRPLLKWHLIEQPLTILRIIRIQNYLVYTIVCHFALKAINVKHGNRSAAELFVISSYITWSYQSHSFSNSIETILLLAVLALFTKFVERKSGEHENQYKKSFLLGTLITLGTFNRITFAGFILLPFVSLFLRFYCGQWRSFFVLIISIIICSVTFVCFDTAIYQSSSYVVAPINNLLYNLDESNLALHGIHPRITHMFVNLPQIVGPGIILLPNAFRSFSKVCENQAALSVLSGMTFLSLFKHQELRFLTPLAPLLFSCFIPRSPFKRLKWEYIFRAWFLFNLIAGLIMGVLHQGGILRAINDFHKNESPINVHIWWKTYSPPGWMYRNKNLTVSAMNIVNGVESIDEIPFHVVNNHVIDLRGSNLELLIKSLIHFENAGASVTLIAPNSMRVLLNSMQDTTNFRLERLAEWKLHLDLDHIDFSNPSSLALGLASYNVSS